MILRTFVVFSKKTGNITFDKLKTDMIYNIFHLHIISIVTKRQPMSNFLFNNN